jgi:hypothetical protein
MIKQKMEKNFWKIITLMNRRETNSQEGILINKFETDKY